MKGVLEYSKNIFRERPIRFWKTSAFVFWSRRAKRSAIMRKHSCCALLITRVMLSCFLCPLAKRQKTHRVADGQFSVDWSRRVHSFVSRHHVARLNSQLCEQFNAVLRKVAVSAHYSNAASYQLLISSYILWHNYRLIRDFKE